MGKRFFSLIVDHFIMSLIVAGLAAPMIISDLTENTSIINIILLSIGLSAYFNKDIFGGRSIAKRIFNLKVNDCDRNETASPLKCFIRNLFGVIWIIDMIFFFLKNGRRLGDIVCGTEVIEYKSNEEAKSNNTLSIVLVLAFSFALIFLLCYGLLPVIYEID